MKIHILNLHPRLRPDKTKLSALACFFASRAWNHRCRAFPAALSVVLTDDSGISLTNSAFLNCPSSTDVIAFALPGIPGFAGYEGEIHINVERAAEQGARRKGMSCELALYLAHGCDHLAGSSDKTPKSRRAMICREQRWVAAARSRGLIDKLMPENQSGFQKCRQK